MDSILSKKSSRRKCKIKILVYEVSTFWILFTQLQGQSSAASVIRGNKHRSGVDLSLESDTIGFEVVESCIHKIHRSQIFPQDFDFLERTAMVESGYGLGLVETNNFTGGIWRVSKRKFDLTKTFILKATSSSSGSVYYQSRSNSAQLQHLKEARRKISEQFSIHWMTVTWDELRKPFYSALAFRLFFHWVQYQYQNQTQNQNPLQNTNVSNQSASSDNHEGNHQQQYHPDQDQGQQNLDEQIAIPETLEKQASHWAKYYHNNKNDLAEEDFIYILAGLERKRKMGTYASSCGGKAKMDLVVLLDGSTGVDEKNFEMAKGFVADLFNLYSFSNGQKEKTGVMPGPAALVRFGFVVFSSRAFTMFTLSNKLTPDRMRSVVKGTKHPGPIQSRGTHTDTNSGILDAIKLFTDPHLSYSHSDSDRDRAGAAKVMIILTNGNGNVNKVSSVSDEGNDEMAGTPTRFLPPILQARELNITTFAISIGPNFRFRKDELLQLAHGQPSHVFSLTDYQHLKTFYQRLNASPCTPVPVPVPAPIPEFSRIVRQIFDNHTNETITVATDTLKRKEKRHYRFDLPENSEGLTVFLTSQNGGVKGFYSYLCGKGIQQEIDTVLFPSSALHNGLLTQDANGTFISSSSADFDSNLNPNTLTLTSALKVKRSSSEPSTSNGNNGKPMEGPNLKRILELRKRNKIRRMEEIRGMLTLWFQKENGKDYENDSGDNNSDSDTDSVTDDSDNDSDTDMNQRDGIRTFTVLITIQGFEILNNYTIQTVSSSGAVKFHLSSPLVNQDIGTGTGIIGTIGSSAGMMKLKAISETIPSPTPPAKSSFTYVTLLLILLVHFVIFGFIIACLLVGRKIINSRRE